MALTLAQLLAVPSEDEIQQQVLSDLNQNDFPITDWESGGVMRTFVEMLKQAYLVFAGQLIPKIAGGGYLSEADDDWLPLLAEQSFGITQQVATPTIQQATLTCDGANGPYTITVGQLTAVTLAGRRYSNITGGTLPTSGTLALQWQSEGPNDSSVAASNYIDGAATMTLLATPLPGVTINNPAIDFTAVTKGASATSLVTASRTVGGTPPASGTILIKITVLGDVGVAQFSYRRITSGPTDAGYTGALATGASVVIPDVGTTLAFVNSNPLVSPTFQLGDVFSVSSPGGPILVQGRDKETPAALALRCQDRWPALSLIPTFAKLRLWAFAADPQVTKVGVRNDDTVPGQVNLTIGGQLNPLGGGVIAAVQSYIDMRSGEDSFVIVTTATTRNVMLNNQPQAVVTCRPGTTAAVQAAADAAWQSYIASIDLGGLVRLSSLQEILRDVGAIDAAGLGIFFANEAAVGGFAQVNLRLKNTEVAVVAPGYLPSQALHWFEATS